MYMRNLYHEFFWGPFLSEDEVGAAMKSLDKADKDWDYDPVSIVYGASPLPNDYLSGFPLVNSDTRARIEKKRAS